MLSEKMDFMSKTAILCVCVCVEGKGGAQGWDSSSLYKDINYKWHLLDM